MRFKIFALFVLIATCAFAQQAPDILTQTYGASVPDPGTCRGTQDVHRTYWQNGNPASAFAGGYICVQSTATEFAWAALVMLPPGTTGTHSTATLTYGSFCGSTVGNATCANYTDAGTVHTVSGLATLASNSAVISGISPAFTGTATFACTSNDTTTVTNPTKVVNTSTSSITITNTTGASDVVAYSCVGY